MYFGNFQKKYITSNLSICRVFANTFSAKGQINITTAFSVIIITMRCVISIITFSICNIWKRTIFGSFTLNNVKSTNELHVEKWRICILLTVFTITSIKIAFCNIEFCLTKSICNQTKVSERTLRFQINIIFQDIQRVS